MGNDGESSNSACRVSVRVPPFWPERADLWFVQLEAQFAIAGITADSTKFYHVISQLEQRYLIQVDDVVNKPPADGKYEKIKETLISRLTPSNKDCLRQVVKYEELGNRKPSQLLRHMRSLGRSAMTDEMLLFLWSTRQPAPVQAFIATQPSNMDLDTLAELADKVNEVSTQPILTTPSANPAPVLQYLRHQSSLFCLHLVNYLNLSNIVNYYSR